MSQRLIDEARRIGPIHAGGFRVIVESARVTHHDFDDLAEARAYADDVASEGEDPFISAVVVDASLSVVYRGRHYASQRDAPTRGPAGDGGGAPLPERAALLPVDPTPDPTPDPSLDPRHGAREVAWSRTWSATVPLQARVGGSVWALRLNDFPAEPLYTLFVDGKEIGPLDELPPSWRRPTGFGRLRRVRLVAWAHELARGAGSAADDGDAPGGAAPRLVAEPLQMEIGPVRPVARTWEELRPAPRDADDELGAAIARMRALGAKLAGDPVERCAERLHRGAEELVRAAVLVGPNATAPLSAPLDGALARALRGLEATAQPASIAAYAGVLCQLNAKLGVGGEIAGLFDRTTRRALELEWSWLAALAARRGECTERQATLLGFAALAAGAHELVPRFASAPPAVDGAKGDAAGPYRRGGPFGAAEEVEVRSLLRAAASALRAGEAPPDDLRATIEELVGSFPARLAAGELPWSALLMLGRAHVVHVERRGPGGIGAAAAWLHRTVTRGPTTRTPEPAPQQVAPKPADEATARRARELFTEARRPAAVTGWSSIGLSEIHGLYGGCAIWITSQGVVHAEEVSPAKRSRRFRATLSKAGLAGLDALLRAHDPRSMVVPGRPGIPDEGFTVLTLDAASPKPVTVSKWAGVEHAGFEALRRWLVDAVRVLATCAAPTEELPWEPGWSPDLGPGR